ncbi:thiamine biosynthesis protein ThiS [Bacillus methanolicus]|uniref:sulfur carrier protein ThiS n=1 Tax=Bacillus methanolicus TaxID=1471 RepID=UPI0023808092|nr:sulfur carrier protein ThiS [Bacillus methanolicus]MDE3840675.1 thiamine biosynthesis protein ThiS [Bacillus methanolicus]
MKLIINGDVVELSNEVRTIQDLLAHFNLQDKGAIVELNREILEKSAHAEAYLSDGDKIEIVHFVGGG